MKNAYWILISLMLANCSINNVGKIEQPPTADAEIIDYLFSECLGNQPGTSVMVIKEGKVVHEKSYGFANLEEKIKTTPTTNYRIASVSKQFTAMAIMILINQGKLTYETKLTDIFPDFPSYGNHISVRHLLSNQSGLVDYFEFIDEDRTQQYLDKEILAGLMKLDSTNFQPGTKYEYSNTGYAVLAQIIEKVSKRTFAEFMKEAIFQKLEMTNSKVYEANENIENRAFGYTLKNDSIKLNDQSSTSAIQGDGGVYCSIRDYYKWDQALYTDKLIPKDQLEDAFYDWEHNSRTNKDGYGYGWYVDYHEGIKLLNHSGGTVGFETRVSRIPSLKLTVVIFTNTDRHDRNIMHMVNALTSIYSDYKIPMPIDIMMKKEIDLNGKEYGNKIYDELKNNPRYKKEETTLSYLGFEYRRMGKLTEAEELFIKATKVHPNYFGGYYGLGRVYLDTKEKDKAILNFQKIIALGTEAEEWVVIRAKKELEQLLESN